MRRKVPTSVQPKTCPFVQFGKIEFAVQFRCVFFQNFVAGDNLLMKLKGDLYMVIQAQETFIFGASLQEVKEAGALRKQLGGRPVVFFAYGDNIYAIDNRCPHMGFPMDKGSIQDGIITCHWHHARFDLGSGGTFDLWADDLDAFPVEIRDEAVWVDLTSSTNTRDHQFNRLQDGLERNLSLVIAKAVIRLLGMGVDKSEIFERGILFGTRYHNGGWQRGLTTLASFVNLTQWLEPADHARALYHGLADTASELEGRAPRFELRPLPTETSDLKLLKQWFKQFVEVRDTDGAERCIVSAVRAGADDKIMADMLFSAATDHRYIDVGHSLDFTNKAFESLDKIGWDHAEQVLSSIVPLYTNAQRMEESNSWRYPIDLIKILHKVFDQLDNLENSGTNTDVDYDAMIPVLLDEDPQAIVDLLLDALKNGAEPSALAGVVTYAAALRIAQFPTSNEFGDWDTAMHTFTFSNAVQQGLRRVNSRDLWRGIFDAAMSVYLDRFLNVPSVKLPSPNGNGASPQELLTDSMELLNLQQQVNPAGKMVVNYLNQGGELSALMARLGRLLLREDRNFHTIQCVEAGFQQVMLHEGTERATHFLVAVARYLAAHAPTMRAQGQTYTIADRLCHGDNVFE